jgi:hypothetical protein
LRIKFVGCLNVFFSKTHTQLFYILFKDFLLFIPVVTATVVVVLVVVVLVVVVLVVVVDVVVVLVVVVDVVVVDVVVVDVVVVLEVIPAWFNNIISTSVPITAAIPYAPPNEVDNAGVHVNAAPPSVVLYTSIVPAPVPIPSLSIA